MDLDEIKSPLPPRPVNELPPDLDQPVPPPAPTLPPADLPPPSIPVARRPKLLIPLLAVLLAVFLIFLVIKLLGSIKRKTSGPLTLNYYGLWEESSVIAGLIADFESKNHGIKINYLKNQKDNYRTRVISKLVKNLDADRIDIFRIHSSWLPMFKDHLAPLPTATIANLKLDSDFYQVYQRDLKSDSSYLAVPLMYDGLSLFYNKDLLDTAQVTLPKTWWGLENSAVKLTTKSPTGRIIQAGAALGLTDNVDHWSDIIGLMLKQNSVDPTKNDAVNLKKLADILTFYTQFITKDAVWDSNQPNSTLLFANGKLAFYFAPSWRIFDLDALNNPSLRFGITTVPQLATLETAQMDQIEAQSSTDNLTNIHWATYWVEAVNRQSPYQKEAWKFLEFLASADSLEKMYQAAAQIRSFGEIYPRKILSAKLSTDLRLQAFTAAAHNASSWYLSSRTFDQGLNDDMIAYFADAVNKIINDRQDPVKVAADLHVSVKQLRDRYHFP